VIEVRDDGDIFVDGKLLIGTLRRKTQRITYIPPMACRIQ
jgi:hypothetical protein